MTWLEQNLSAAGHDIGSLRESREWLEEGAKLGRTGAVFEIHPNIVGGRQRSYIQGWISHDDPVAGVPIHPNWIDIERRACEHGPDLRRSQSRRVGPEQGRNRRRMWGRRRRAIKMWKTRHVRRDTISGGNIWFLANGTTR